MTAPDGSYHDYLVNRAALYANIPGMTPLKAEALLGMDLAELPDRIGEEGVRSNADVAEDIPGIVAHRFKNHDGNGYAGQRSDDALDDERGATPQKAKNSGGGFGAFMAKQFPKREYVLHGLARGMVGMIHADESSYKSWNAVNLAMMAACGRPHPVFTKAKPDASVATSAPRNTAYAAPRRVVYKDFENDAETLQEIMAGLAPNFDEYETELINENLYVVVDAVIGNPDSEDEDEALTLSDRAHLRGLADEIAAFYGEGNSPDLLIVDTLAEGFDLPEENSNGKQGAGLVSAAVRYLRHRLSNPAIVLVHHNSKRSGGDGEANQSDETRFRGATRLSNMCRWRWGQTQKRDARGQYVKGTAVGVHYKSKGPKINGGEPVEMVFDFEQGGLLVHADFNAAPVRPASTVNTDPRHKAVKAYLMAECNLNDRGATSQAGEILDQLDSDPSGLKGWLIRRHKNISERTADRRSQRIREITSTASGVTGV